MKTTTCFRQVVASTLLGLLSMAAAAHAAAPVNDTALKAVQFQGNYQLITTPNLSTATAAATDPMINGASVGKTIWYRVTAAEPSYSPYWHLSVRSTGGAGFVGVYLANDPDNPLTSLSGEAPSTIAAGQTLTFPAVEVGNYSAYYLMLAGSGTFEITHHLRSASAENDFPFIAKDVGTADRGTVSYSNNCNGTVTADEPVLPVGIAHSVWYKWTPTFSGTAAVDTNFSFIGDDTGQTSGVEIVHNTVLAVYTGTPQALNLVGWDDDGGTDTNSRLVFDATAGVSYYIAVATKEGTIPGDFLLNYYRANTAGVIDFEVLSSMSANETTGYHLVKVRRRYAGNFGTTVQLATVAGGTATATVDYQALNTTLTFAASAWEAGANLFILDDTLNEINEFIQLKLTSPGGTATLGGTDNMALSIEDNETEAVDESAPFFLKENFIRVKEGSWGTSSVARNAIVRIHPSGAAFYITQAIMPGTTAEKNQDFFTDIVQILGNELQTPFDTTITGDDLFEPDEVIKYKANFVDSAGQPQWNACTIIIEDDDPYIPVSGKLVSALNCGERPAQVFAAISGTGAVSGKLLVLGKTLPLKGQLDWRGKARFTLLPAGRAKGFMLTLEATDATGGFKLSLNDGLTNRATSASVVLQNYSPKFNPCPEAGRYTVVTDSHAAVACTSAGALTVDASGNAAVIGRLFDGTPFTAAGYVDGDGGLFTQASLYASLGNVAFKSRLPQAAAQLAAVDCTLVRPSRAGDPTKLAPIATRVTGSLYRYSPPAAGQRALDCWSTGMGKATLTGGPLMNMLTKALTISDKNIVAAPVDAEKLTLKLAPATGTFTGSFLPPGALKPLPIFGALIDLPTTNGYGQGFFFNGLKGGKIIIGQP